MTDGQVCIGGQVPRVETAALDSLPQLAEVRLSFPRPRVEDVGSAVRQGLARLTAGARFAPGTTVAVTAGSRGITNIVAILRAACGFLREAGARPVVVSAMGSHGGDSVAGQRHILESLGITEQAVGAEVHVSTETAGIGTTPGGVPVRLDRFAATEADGVLVVNRIKPHTAFHSATESGLLKMIAVGLGHQSGAAAVHGAGPGRMGETIRQIAALAIERLPLLGGLAVLENAYEDTAAIVALEPAEFLGREPSLLVQARTMLPGLPVRGGDVLIVERIGKEISGTGMDTNVIGRFDEGDASQGAGFRRLVVLGLTEASDGNATGIGLADFTTEQVVRSMDRHSTYTNCLTSTLIDRARLPLFYATEREAIAAAVVSLGAVDRTRLRVVQIQDTLHLERLRLSENLLDELSLPPGTNVEVAPPASGSRSALAFDAAGRLDRII